MNLPSDDLEFAFRRTLTSLTDTPHTSPPYAMLVALSGGLDSCALLHLVHNLYSSTSSVIHAVHVHHGLRDDADEDEQFCRMICATLHIPLKVVRLHVAHRNSTQHTARVQRYAAFARIAKEVGASYVLTAHHQDDRLENVLMRLARGSSLETCATGLVHTQAPLPYAHHTLKLTVLRPLLSHTRQELEAWMHTQQHTWHEDPSNTSDDYTRNHVRHHALPKLLAATPQARAGMLRTLDNLLKDTDYITQCVQHLEEDAHIKKPRPGLMTANRKSLQNAHPALRARIWTRCAQRLPAQPRWGHVHHTLLNDTLAKKNNGTLVLKGARVSWTKETLFIEAAHEQGAGDLDQRIAHPILLRIDDNTTSGTIDWFDGTLNWELVAHQDKQREALAQGATLLEYPETKTMHLRGARPGEHVWQGQRSRKIKEVLRTEGVPQHNRWWWPCLAIACTDKIVWVAPSGLVQHHNPNPNNHVMLALLWSTTPHMCR